MLWKANVEQQRRPRRTLKPEYRVNEILIFRTKTSKIMDEIEEEPEKHARIRARK